MSLIRKHGAVLQAWACLDLVGLTDMQNNDLHRLLTFPQSTFCEVSVSVTNMHIYIHSIFSAFLFSMARLKPNDRFYDFY